MLGRLTSVLLHLLLNWLVIIIFGLGLTRLGHLLDTRSMGFPLLFLHIVFKQLADRYVVESLPKLLIALVDRVGGFVS
jgi:hypothetical protein